MNVDRGLMGFVLACSAVAGWCASPVALGLCVVGFAFLRHEQREAFADRWGPVFGEGRALTVIALASAGRGLLVCLPIFLVAYVAARLFNG